MVRLLVRVYLLSGSSKSAATTTDKVTNHCISALVVAVLVQ